MKIYIAGRITGNMNYKAEFNQKKDELEREGHIVLNPAMLPCGLQNSEYMRICFMMIDMADVVCFLPGFTLSPGARLEAEYCFYIDKTVWLPEDESL